MSRKVDDRGFATVWTAGAVAAILVLSVLLVWHATAVAARHRATAAADLAALAAAGHARAGPAQACDVATTAAARMGAGLVGCELRGWDARVTVAVDLSGIPGGFGAARARARAGPADP